MPSKYRYLGLDGMKTKAPALKDLRCTKVVRQPICSTRLTMKRQCRERSELTRAPPDWHMTLRWRRWQCHELFRERIIGRDGKQEFFSLIITHRPFSLPESTWFFSVFHAKTLCALVQIFLSAPHQLSPLLSFFPPFLLSFLFTSFYFLITVIADPVLLQGAQDSNSYHKFHLNFNLGTSAWWRIYLR